MNGELGNGTAEDRMHFHINFVGYWSIASIGVAACPGIYCIFSGTSTRVNRLLYIGESYNIEDRIRNHEKYYDWAYAANGQALFFTVAALSPTIDRSQLEAALIHWYKPTCNVEYVHNFPFPTTTVSMRGPIESLNKHFTVGGT